MRLFSRRFRRGKTSAAIASLRAGGSIVAAGKELHTADQIRARLRFADSDPGLSQYRTLLYRFLTENVPIINAVIFTWARITAAPGEFELNGDLSESVVRAARRRVEDLSPRIYQDPAGHPVGLHTFLTDLAVSLFRDGIYGGFLAVHSDGSGVDRFIPADSRHFVKEINSQVPQLFLESDRKRISLNRPDFYWMALEASAAEPFGHSILQAIPFVTYIEQQLVNDMRRSSHNAGFQRLHVKITPPERNSGESDTAFIDRINKYFDDTVSMIKSCDVDENPVTWDNVAIDYVGPTNNRSTSGGWFAHHRAMIEEICAGTGLAPFLLGYSFGATNTWSAFKFDIVMRQVRTLQQNLSQFIEWIANVDLALAGIDATVSYRFDNSFAYQALDKSKIDSERIDDLIKLHQAGLIDKQTATDKLRGII